MFNVLVYGWVPDKEIGEVPFESFVYHVELIDNRPRFLIYNPYEEEFEVVGSSAVRPAVFTQQPIITKKKMESYKKLLEEREKEKNAQV